MTEFVLHNAQDGYQTIKTGAWPLAKSHLIAGRKLLLTIRDWEDTQTEKQRRYYFGAVIAQIVAQAKINGMGATKDGWHNFFKREYIGYRVTQEAVAGRKRTVTMRKLGSLKDLRVRAMNEYIEKVTAHAATEFGVQFGGWIDPVTGEIYEAGRKP